MEIKAQLINYTDKQRQDFIVTYNHNQGYEIKEYSTQEYKKEEVENPETGEMEVVEYANATMYIEAWGYTEEELAQQKRERVAMLSLTRGDVFRGLLQARGVTRAMLRGMIESNEQLTEVQKEMALIDFDEALNFYRGNALIDTVGLALGIEPAQLDAFFETNDYTTLLVKTDEKLPTDEIVEQEGNAEVENG